MNTLVDEAVQLARAVARAGAATRGVEVVVCPPFVNLGAVAEALQGTRVALGAQNVADEKQGAFTGEVSADMLVAVGCRYCIVGHSERRQLYGEGDGIVARKLRLALDAGLAPIACVGETLEERREGAAQTVVERQLGAAYEGLSAQEAGRTVVAYEPVWAIGTGETATPAQAQEMHAAIRAWLRTRYDAGTARAIPLLYGGSMKPQNAAELLAQPDVDGGLIGGASLDADAFQAIVDAAAEAA